MCSGNRCFKREHAAFALLGGFSAADGAARRNVVRTGKMSILEAFVALLRL